MGGISFYADVSRAVLPSPIKSLRLTSPGILPTSQHPARSLLEPYHHVSTLRTKQILLDVASSREAHTRSTEVNPSAIQR